MRREEYFGLTFYFELLQNSNLGLRHNKSPGDSGGLQEKGGEKGRKSVWAVPSRPARVEKVKKAELFSLNFLSVSIRLWLSSLLWKCSPSSLPLVVTHLIQGDPLVWLSLLFSSWFGPVDTCLEVLVTFSHPLEPNERFPTPTVKSTLEKYIPLSPTVKSSLVSHFKQKSRIPPDIVVP